MEAREGLFGSYENMHGATSRQQGAAWLDSDGNDEFSQRPDYGSQSSLFGMSSPVLSVPSSQVHHQLPGRVLRPRVTPIDPVHLAAWARRAAAQPLPQSPPSIVDGGHSIPNLNAPPTVFASSSHLFRAQSPPAHAVTPREVQLDDEVVTEAAPTVNTPANPSPNVSTPAAANLEGNPRPGNRMNWQEWQITQLIECKKIEWEEFESVQGREHIVSSEVKWKRVQANLKERNVVADVNQIRGKWEGLLGWYKAVKDWNHKFGNPSYDSLSRADRKLAKLPVDFKEAWGDLLDTFYGRRASFAPPCVSESLAQNINATARGSVPTSPDGSSAHPPDESGDGESSGGERTSPPTTSAPRSSGVTHGGAAIQGNSGVKRKKNQSASATAIQESMNKLSRSLVEVEKTREEREQAKLQWLREAEECRLLVQSSVSDSIGRIASALSNFVDKFPVRPN